MAGICRIRFQDPRLRGTPLQWSTSYTCDPCTLPVCPRNGHNHIRSDLLGSGPAQETSCFAIHSFSACSAPMLKEPLFSPKSFLQVARNRLSVSSVKVTMSLVILNYLLPTRDLRIMNLVPLFPETQPSLISSSSAEHSMGSMYGLIRLDIMTSSPSVFRIILALELLSASQGMTLGCPRRGSSPPSPSARD